MICVLFSGFLGRVPYGATRISTSVTFRVSRGSPIRSFHDTILSVQGEEDVKL
jgi:hypothetical protein